MSRSFMWHSVQLGFLVCEGLEHILPMVAHILGILKF